jgi:tetratricopeptide (TPR) repeat protein
VPERDQIFAALEHLLEWPEMARSPQLAKFAAYIVGRTLDGEQQAIKAYSIAVDVFGRSADFDPQADPIVRVQARRLRALLDSYYQGPGAEEPVRILLPVGRYVPEFHLADALPGAVVAPAIAKVPPAAAPRGGITLSWSVLAVIAVGVGAVAFSLSSWQSRQDAQSLAQGAVQRPSLGVSEFQNLIGPGRRPLSVSGLAIELVTDLEAFETLDVHYDSGAVSPDAAPAPVGFALSGIARVEVDAVQYSAILTDTRTSDIVWSQVISLPLAQASEPLALDEVSRRLSLVLGSTRGPVHAAARQFLASGVALAGNENLYLCRVAFDLYRDTGNAEAGERAKLCFAGLPDGDSRTAGVLAAVASLIAETGSAAGSVDSYRMAQTGIERAIAAAPVSAFVWEQQARLFQGMGEQERAEAAFGSAVQLNPASADALAGYARLLAFDGNIEKAAGLAEQSVNATLNPPAWYFGVPALVALRNRDFATAIAHAEIYTAADRELGPVLAIMAGQDSGNGAVVDRYLPQVLDIASFRGAGVLPQLRKRISDAGLLGRIGATLAAAGVPPSALNAAF